MRSTRSVYSALAAGMLLSICGGAGCHGAEAELGANAPRLQLTSPSFSDQGPIPAALTCDGGNRSPALAWSPPPGTARSLALTVTDPDAPIGTFTHWVLFNLPASSRSLPDGVPPEGRRADGSIQGNNDFGNPGYGGPCPPSGVHHYVFVLYAVDTALSLAPGASRRELENALKGHVVARGKLVGTYHR
jgi:Raf kinase inhibitor-like YbhB/YbcL family protein